MNNKVETGSDILPAAGGEDMNSNDVKYCSRRSFPSLSKPTTGNGR